MSLAEKNLTRRSLLSRGIVAGAAICLDRGFLLAATAETANPPDLAEDPRRPQYHLLAPSNWMNDPNGPIYWNGKYHMFYQANPACPCFGKMTWGHAVSPDMLHWKHLPTALTPTPGPDSYGCWSGTAAVRDGVVTVMYTGVSIASKDISTVHANGIWLREQQCLAYSTDPDLKTWTKWREPAIDAPPGGLPHLNGFRDPSPWRQGEDWYAVIGTGMPKTGGAILLYRSKDLRRWEYQHIAASGDNAVYSAANPVDRKDMWECPDLFELDGKHVLICSTKRKAHWQTGVLDKKTMLFHCERTGVVDHGAFYAPKSQLDKDGNRILWGWIQETCPENQYRQAGWAGVMSLPRVLSLAEDGSLMVNVAPAVETLRRKHQRLTITENEGQNQRHIAQMFLESACGEVLCTVPTAAGAFSVSLLEQGGENADWVTVNYDPAQKDSIAIDNQPVPIDLRRAAELEVHIYVDGSVLEIFLNRQVAYTKRVYFRGAKAPRLGVRIDGSLSKLRELSLWQLAPISPNRLTI